MPGYRIGPIIPDGTPPWPTGWEQAPSVSDGHAHAWECCLLAPGPRRRRFEEVVRCSVCNAPRCGHSTDPNPCMERRHHRGPHLWLRGAVTPVGRR